MSEDAVGGLALVVEVGESEGLSRTLPLEQVHAALQLFQMLHLMVLCVVFTHGSSHHHLFLLLLDVVLHILVFGGRSLFLVLQVSSVA